MSFPIKRWVYFFFSANRHFCSSHTKTGMAESPRTIPHPLISSGTTWKTSESAGTVKTVACRKLHTKNATTIFTLLKKPILKS